MPERGAPCRMVRFPVTRIPGLRACFHPCHTCLMQTSMLQNPSDSHMILILLRYVISRTLCERGEDREPGLLDNTSTCEWSEVEKKTGCKCENVMPSGIVKTGTTLLVPGNLDCRIAATWLQQAGTSRSAHPTGSLPCARQRHLFRHPCYDLPFPLISTTAA